MSYKEIDKKLVAQEQKIDKVLDLLKGDEFGNEGLVSKQRRDDEFRIEIHQDLKVIKSNQEGLDGRLESLESFFEFFKLLTAVKRKTLIIIGSIIALLGSLATGWDKFIHLFKH